MKLWVDDVRPAPEGYVWCKSVNNAILKIQMAERRAINLEDEVLQYLRKKLDKDAYLILMKMITRKAIEVIDIDHDAGDYVSDGGDYIKILDWLEETGRNYPIRTHSMNPVGVENMRRIIERNGWKEIR